MDYKYYTSLGWKVFPIRPKEKTPMIRGWQNKATSDPKVAWDLFGSFPDDCNIAAVTGDESGFFVLDVDMKRGKDGMSALNKMIEENGELPRTTTAKTPNGGIHLYFSMPECDIRNKVEFAEGLDVRANGGYIMLPGSVVEGDKTYTWEDGKSPREVKPQPAPLWLIKIIHQAKNNLSEKIKPSLDPKGKIDKNRNQILTKIAGGLKRQGLNREAILAALLVVNEKRCDPPLPEHEIEALCGQTSKWKGDNPEWAGPFTDMWNAEKFAIDKGTNVRFTPELGWMAWTGKIWAKDRADSVVALAKDFARRILDLSEDSGNVEFYKHAVKTQSEKGLMSMIRLSKSEGLSVDLDDFDSDKFLINCRNGILDLKSGELIEHSKEYLMSRMTSVNYNSEATCPRWERFIKEIFQEDEDLCRYVQKALGYSLSGDISEQPFFILYGVGANGKSTMISTVYDILGSYAIGTPADTLLDLKNKSNVSNDIARMKGARFVSASESEPGQRLAESKIKVLTGDDVISARFHYKEFFDFKATGKIFFSTNHKPVVKGGDHGIWRRLKMIPFGRVFRPEEMDKELPEKLKAESEGIFNWLVNGFKMWKEEGLGTCEAVSDATETYSQEADTLGLFIASECVEFPESTVPAQALYDAANNWLRDHHSYTMSRPTLIDYFEHRGFKKTRLHKGADKGKVHYVGIGLKHKR